MHMEITRRSFLLKSGLATLGYTLMGAKYPSIADPILRFGVVTDSHYADREKQGTRYYRQSLEKMQECISVFNQEKVDFAIHLGDFKDQDREQRTEDTLSYLKALEFIYAQFNGPRYHCVGNHDVDSITKQQFLQNITNSNIPNTDSYYQFISNDIQFIVLDANFDKDGRDHFYLEGANWQDIRVPKPEVKWLKKVLKKNKRPTIVFCHHPLFEYQKDDHTYHIQNYKEIQQVLEKSDQVLAVFQGHTHEERHQVINGIHYLTFLGMVDYSGIENNAYAIVELYSDARMEVIGYRRIENKMLKTL